MVQPKRLNIYLLAYLLFRSTKMIEHISITLFAPVKPTWLNISISLLPSCSFKATEHILNPLVFRWCKSGSKSGQYKHNALV